MPAADVATSFPHSPQKRIPAGFSLPQKLHWARTPAPQEPQNFMFGISSAEQFGQFTTLLQAIEMAGVVWHVITRMARTASHQTLGWSLGLVAFPANRPRRRRLQESTIVARWCHALDRTPGHRSRGCHAALTDDLQLLVARRPISMGSVPGRDHSRRRRTSR